MYLQNKRSLWKTTAEKEATKLLSSMNVEQLRQEITKLQEKEREQRQRMQQVYLSHLADLTKALNTLVEQKENIKCVTQSAQKLSLFCQQWSEQQKTEKYSLQPHQDTGKEKPENLVLQHSEESMISKLEQCREDLSCIVDSLEQATRDLDSGDLLGCQLSLSTMRKRKEQLEERLCLTTEPLKQFLSSLSNSEKELSNERMNKISESLKTSAKLDASTGFIYLLMLNNGEQNASLDEKWRLFLDLRYRCFSHCLSAMSIKNCSLEVLEALVNSVATTLLIYDKLLGELCEPTRLETIVSLENFQLESNITVLHFLHPESKEFHNSKIWVVLEDYIIEWLEKVNQNMKCSMEEYLKLVITEQNVDELSQFFHRCISELDTFSTDRHQNVFLKQVENLKQVWTMSLVTCIRQLFESILNATFTEATQRIEKHLEKIRKENISTCIETSSYWKCCGDWSNMFWMYIDQERNDHRKIFTSSLLDSDKCSWEVWLDEFVMKDMNIRMWYDPFMEHLQQLFHQTFPFLLSLLFNQEKQSVLESIHKQILQSYSEFLRSLEEQLNSFLSLVCLLCHEEQVENIEYVSKQDFVLSCLLYLYRCVRLLRHGNLFSSFSEELGADIGEEKNRIIMEMEFKCQYHLIHHVVHLSMIHSLTKQSLSYTCADKVSTCSSASWDHLDPKYPSESLIRWFMELGKYTQLVDALHFSDNIATIRFLIGSHFLKWLEYCGVVQNLQEGKLTNVSEVLQLFMDLMLIRDICLVQQDSPSIAEQESNISIHTKWEEYSSLVENFLGNQSLPNDWKQQIHFHICFHLDTMRHVFGKLSIRNQSKQEVTRTSSEDTFTSLILPPVARFPYLPAPTPSLLYRHRNKRISENPLLDNLETKQTIEHDSSNKQKKENTNTSVVNFASQFVGQQMGRFSSKFLESLRTYGGNS